MGRFYRLLGVDATRDKLFIFETSWLVSPLVLGLIRACFAFYLVFTIFFILGWNGTHGRQQANERMFAYFTSLNAWGETFYFVVAAIHTLLYASRGRSVFFERVPRVFRALHMIYFTTVTIFPFIVVIVYWVLLYNGTWFPIVYDAWSNISQHLLIGPFALIELILCGVGPRPLLTLAFAALIVALYLGLAYIVHATQGFYVYPFLDPSKHGALVAGYVFGIAALGLVIFGVGNLILWAVPRFSGSRRKFSSASRQPTTDEMAELGMMEEPK